MGTGEESGHALKSPPAIHHAMQEILQAGRASGEVKPGIDPSLLSDRICLSMLHVGVGISHLTPGGEALPDTRIHILLDGLAAQPPSNAALDRSVALKAARVAIASWDQEGADDDERLVHLRAVARTEFGRRGYEVTTMRDIASASGLSTGTVYRLLGSKDELLISIMSSYVDKVSSAWDAVVRSDSTSLFKIDVLMWVTINVLDTLSEEFKITLAWLRQSPPSSAPALGMSFPEQLRHVRTLPHHGDARRRDSSSKARPLKSGPAASSKRSGVPVPTSRNSRRRKPTHWPATPCCAGRPPTLEREPAPIDEGPTGVSEPKTPGPERLRLLASAVAGRPLSVAALEPPETQAWTDGVTVFVDPTATPREQVRSVAVQASLLSSGSLDAEHVSALARGRPSASGTWPWKATGPWPPTRGSCPSARAS